MSIPLLLKLLDALFYVLECLLVVTPCCLLFPLRQVAARLQKEVEDLVLEVFERLPQTVDGFRDGDIAGSGMEVSGCFQTRGGDDSRAPLDSPGYYRLTSPP